MAKDQQGAAGVKFGGHDQHPMRAQRLQASAYVGGLSVGRQSNDRAYRDAVCLGKAVHVFLRNVGQRLIVDYVSRLNIQKDARRDALAQQLESASRTDVGLP